MTGARGLYLEARAGAKKPEIADLLAHHFTRTKRTDRAVQYLAMAADKSLRLFSLKETLSYLEVPSQDFLCQNCLGTNSSGAAAP